MYFSNKEEPLFEDQAIQSQNSSFNKLDQLIGLASIKEEVRGMVQKYIGQKRLEENGVPRKDQCSIWYLKDHPVQEKQRSHDFLLEFYMNFIL